MNTKEWWVNTEEFRPDYGEHVLVYQGTKIKPCVYKGSFIGVGHETKVCWWMEFPRDGWTRIDVKRPPIGAKCMTLTVQISMQTRRNSRQIKGNGTDSQRLVYWRRMPDPPSAEAENDDRYK